MPRKPRLTIKQKKFADKYLETGNGTKAALEAYDTTDPVTAGAIAYENLRKPQIVQYTDYHLAQAKMTIAEIMNDTDNRPEVRLQAAKEIVDRVEGKAVNRTVTTDVADDKTATFRWEE